MLLEGRKAGAVLADKAYGSKEILLQIAKNKSEAVMPSKKNARKPRYYDKHLYKERQVVECFFQKLKEFRRIEQHDMTSSTLTIKPLYFLPLILFGLGR